jgi:hypothetical protein
MKAVAAAKGGRYACVAVRVDWPELRLTESQLLANAVARVNDQPLPFDDNSFFSIDMELI